MVTLHYADCLAFVKEEFLVSKKNVLFTILKILSNLESISVPYNGIVQFFILNEKCRHLELYVFSLPLLQTKVCLLYQLIIMTRNI